MAPLTPAGIKSAFSGTPENKAGFQAKTREINHKFLLHLPETGTLPELKAGLKNAKEHLLEQATVSPTGSTSPPTSCGTSASSNGSAIQAVSSLTGRMSQLGVNDTLVDCLDFSKPLKGRAEATVPATAGHDMCRFFVNLAGSVLVEDCKGVVTRESAPHRYLAARGYYAGYDTHIEGPLEELCRAGDLHFKTGSRRFDILFSKGSVKVLVECKMGDKASMDDLGQVEEQMSRLKHYSRINHGLLIAFPKSGNSISWCRHTYSAGSYSSSRFLLSRSEQAQDDEYITQLYNEVEPFRKY